MTAAEMEALAPAPEGLTWLAAPGKLSPGGWYASLVEPPPPGVTCGAWVVSISYQSAELRRGCRVWIDSDYSPRGHGLSPLDALLALRRLAGHLWPWPGWPVVEGVRPAGWGPWARRDVDAHRGDWLVRVEGERILRAESGPAARAWQDRTGHRVEYCAIDADGRWVEVDTRGRG